MTYHPPPPNIRQASAADESNTTAARANESIFEYPLDRDLGFICSEMRDDDRRLELKTRMSEINGSEL